MSSRSSPHLEVICAHGQKLIAHMEGFGPVDTAKVFLAGANSQ